MAVISQPKFSKAFSSIKINCGLKFYWSLFLRVQLTIFTALVHIMVWRSPGYEVLSEQRVVKSTTHIYPTGPQWIIRITKTNKHVYIYCLRKNPQLITVKLLCYSINDDRFRNQHLESTPKKNGYPYAQYSYWYQSPCGWQLWCNMQASDWSSEIRFFHWVTKVNLGWWQHMINSLALSKFECNFKQIIFKQILVIDGWSISCQIALELMSLNFIDD